MRNNQNFDPNNFTPVNEIYARGRITKIGRNNYGAWSITVLTKVRRRDPLHLTFTLADGNGLNALEAREGDIVTIKGYTRAFDHYKGLEKRMASTMMFVATRVEKDQPELAQRFGEGFGRFYSEDVFRSFISGTVVRAERINARIGTLVISTCGGGNDMRESQPVLNYYFKTALPAFDYRQGDVVAIRCSAATPAGKVKPGSDKPAYYYSNLVVEDIDYLYRVPRSEEEVSVGFGEDLGLQMAKQEQDAYAAMLSSFYQDAQDDGIPQSLLGKTEMVG